MCDIWRLRNPNKQGFTWQTNQSLVKRRLDYFFISSFLQSQVQKAEIVTSVSTDHAAITLHLHSESVRTYGPAFWRMNTSLLLDENYVKEIRKSIEKWQDDYYNKEDAQNLWEYLKYQIRQFTISYSKNKARQKRNDIKLLEKELNNVEKQGSLKPEDIEILSEKRHTLEQYYNHITEGIILRSKVKWYEEGERNSKYFLSLEKRNKVKSTIRKLKTETQDITNPQDIMKNIKQFYIKKFESNKQTSSEFSEIFKSLNLPKVSKDDKDLQGRPITKSEIFHALKSMQNNKTPGSDGIPKEFYVAFLIC